MGRAIMGPQATGGFQAPEPYVPESAKAAGALYEAGLAPPVIEAAMQSQISHPASGPNFNEAPTSTPDFSKYEAGFREYQKQNPCLLYTSPSPRDRTRSRMPSSA